MKDNVWSSSFVSFVWHVHEGLVLPIELLQKHCVQYNGNFAWCISYLENVSRTSNANMSSKSTKKSRDAEHPARRPSTQPAASTRSSTRWDAAPATAPAPRRLHHVR